MTREDFETIKFLLTKRAPEIECIEPGIIIIRFPSQETGKSESFLLASVDGILK